MILNFIKNIDLDIKNWQDGAIKQSYYGVDWKKYIPIDLTIECIKKKRIHR